MRIVRTFLKNFSTALSKMRFTNSKVFFETFKEHEHVHSDYWEIHEIKFNQMDDIFFVISLATEKNHPSLLLL